MCDRLEAAVIYAISTGFLIAPTDNINARFLFNCVHPEAKHVANFIRDVSAGKVIVILIRTVH
jgi:hypothetical protein